MNANALADVNDEGLSLPAALLLLWDNAQPVSRRKALTEAARYIRQANRERIRSNVEPDGRAMTRRQVRFGNRPPVMLFLYENRQGKKSFHALSTVSHSRDLNVVGGQWQGTVKNPQGDGDYFTGYDVFSGEIRTFSYERVRRRFKRPPKSAFKMFRQIGRQLRYRREDDQYAIGFWGISGKIARDHQEGRPDRGLPARQLLGLSQADKEAVKQILLDHLLEGIP